MVKRQTVRWEPPVEVTIEHVAREVSKLTLVRTVVSPPTAVTRMTFPSSHSERAARCARNADSGVIGRTSPRSSGRS